MCRLPKAIAHCISARFIHKMFAILKVVWIRQRALKADVRRIDNVCAIDPKLPERIQRSIVIWNDTVVTDIILHVLV